MIILVNLFFIIIYIYKALGKSYLIDKIYKLCLTKKNISVFWGNTVNFITLNCSQANLVLFFLGPIITLIFSLLGYAVVPYGPGLAL